MLQETAAVIYYTGKNLNCAEAMLGGAGEVYDFNIDQTTLATMSTFGGGMGVGSVCGALTGGIAALGVLVKDDQSLDKSARMELIAHFYEQFRQHFGSDLCSQIKEEQFTQELQCESTVAQTAIIFEKIVKVYQARK